MHIEASAKRRHGSASYHNVLSAEQTRSPSHKKGNGRKLDLAGEYVEPDGPEERYETERDRLVGELIGYGIGTKAALSISGRMLELSR